MVFVYIEYKMLVLTCIGLLYLGVVAVGQEVIDCNNEDIVTSVFNEPIDLNFNGTIIVYPNVTIGEIIGTSNNEFEMTYIDAQILATEQKNQNDNETTTEAGAGAGSGKDLIIFTTANFANYAKEQSANRITLRIVFGCQGGRERTLIFFQPIKEGNYFAPLFEQDQYEIVLPTPVFAGFDLAMLMPITATDNDLTNNQIVFTSLDAAAHNIRVATSNITANNRKTSYAILMLERIYLSLPSAITFHITATDSGNPPLNASATIVVRPDPRNSMPAIPKFESAIYSVTLTTNLTLASPVHLALVNETYNSDIRYILGQGDDEQFFTLRSNLSDVSVEFSRPTNESVVLDIKQRNFLVAEVRAEHKSLLESGRTTLIVFLPNFTSHFRFESSLWDGVLLENGTLSVPAIVFDEYAFSDEIDFQLTGNTSVYFELVASKESNKMQLQPSKEFSGWQRKLSYTVIGVNATWKGMSATTTILIKFADAALSSGEKQPEFERALYVGTIGADFELKVDTITLVNDTYNVERTQYNLSGDKAYLFDLAVAENVVRLDLKRSASTEELLVLRNSTNFLVLTASNGNLKGHVWIVMQPEEGSVMPEGNIFNRSWVRGNLMKTNNDRQLLELDRIEVNPQHQIDDITFTLDGDDATYFGISYMKANRSVQIELLTPLPVKVLDEQTHIELELQATHDLNPQILHTLFILIILPKKVCKTQNDTSIVPIFDSDPYVFSATPQQVGPVGRVSATLAQDPDAKIRYTLEADNEKLKGRITIDPYSGEVRLLGFIEEGRYDFNVSADLLEYQVKRTVPAVIEIDSKWECELSLDERVENILVVRHIEEERPYDNLFNLQLGNCTFYVKDFYPNDQAYVYINETTHSLSAIPVDRESETFAAMLVPQINVRLELICETKPKANGSTTARARADIMSMRRWRRDTPTSLIMSEDIPFSKTITILSIIIDDINDNSPVIVVPKATVSTLGYPDRNISLALFPQHLIQVEAIDRDADLNAAIRYSMESNAHFGIESETGVVYPKFNALMSESSTRVHIMASDRNGSAGCRVTNMTIMVRRLSADYFSLFTLRSTDRQDMVRFLSDLSARIDLNIGIVKLATVPTALSARALYGTNSRLAPSQGIIQQAWIYAFASEEPVPYDQLQRKIQSQTDNQLVALDSFQQIGISVGNVSVSVPFPPTLSPPADNNVGYLVALSVLSLACMASLGFLARNMYVQRFVWRQRDVADDTMKRSNSTSTTAPPTPTCTPTPNSNGDQSKGQQVDSKDGKMLTRQPNGDSKRTSNEVLSDIPGDHDALTGSIVCLSQL